MYKRNAHFYLEFVQFQKFNVLTFQRKLICNNKNKRKSHSTVKNEAWKKWQNWLRSKRIFGKNTFSRFSEHSIEM